MGKGEEDKKQLSMRGNGRWKALIGWWQGEVLGRRRGGVLGFVYDEYYSKD